MSAFTVSIVLVLTAFAASLHASETAPDGWKFVTIRDETAAKPAVQQNGGSFGLVISGNGQGISDGRWVKRVPLPSSSFVKFTGRYRAADVEMAARNVIASVVWIDEQDKELSHPEFAATSVPADADGWRHVVAVYRVPEKARQAQIELRLRWSANGRVEWRDVKLSAAEPPAPRRAKLATVNHRPRGGKSAQENLDQFAKLIDEAGSNKADIILLPEAITLIGRGANYLGSAEPIPGPSTEFLGKAAKKNNAYVIAGLLERDGKAAYNTSVLIGRDGKLIGKYRKVCLPRAEIDGGLAPGNEYPVFDTDFGRIGMMICWDVSYPEVARELAVAGAEIIFMPIWGGNETLCRARAIENQVPLVISGYDIRSAIYDAAGEPVAQAPSTDTTIIYAEIDLNQPMNWKWHGNWRSRIWLEGPVRKDPAEPIAAAGQAAGAD